MRALHRWMMLIFGILIAYVAVTGIWLAVVDLTDSRRDWAGDGGGPGATTPTVVGGIDVASAGSIQQRDVAPMVEAALRAARAQSADASVASLELSAAQRQLRATVTLDNASHQRIAVDMATQAVMPDTVDALPGGAGPRTSLHRTVKDLHRGNPPFAGQLGSDIGVRLSLISGVILTLLALTGLYVYLSLWSRRVRIGRTGFFWRDRSLYAWLHRWVSIIAAVFILNQAVTGTLLAWFNLSDPSTQPPPPAATTGYSDAQVSALMQELWRRAHSTAPDAPIMELILTRNGTQPFGPVFFGGPHAGAIGFRLNSNDYIFGTSGAVPPGDASVDSHSLMKRIHRGDFIGHFAGRYMSLFAGASILWLLISGLVMYVQQRQRRAALVRAAAA